MLFLFLTGFTNGNVQKAETEAITDEQRSYFESFLTENPESELNEMIMIALNDNKSTKQINSELKVELTDNTNHSINLTGINYADYLPVKGRLNAMEVAVFNSDPIKGVLALTNASDSESRTKSMYNGTFWGDNSDAYRHGTWNALMVHYVGEPYAKRFADAHEMGASNYNPSNIDFDMDLRNNSIGRAIGRGQNWSSGCANGACASYKISQEIKSRVNNAYFYRFVINGQQKSFLHRTDAKLK